ncbi:MAG: DnaT-like ssDNA-binding protein [Alphaproteobacteria bacterium]
MTLIVESGAGIAGADSYLALADADAHHAARAETAWAAATAGAREAALRRATAGIDGLFAQRWKGRKAVPWTVHGLAWPRAGVLDEAGEAIVGADQMPFALKVAVAAAALIELGRPGALGEAARSIRRVALGPLSVEYADDGAMPPAIALPLAPLLRDVAPAVPRVDPPPAVTPPFRVGLHDGEPA